LDECEENHDHERHETWNRKETHLTDSPVFSGISVRDGRRTAATPRPSSDIEITPGGAPAIKRKKPPLGKAQGGTVLPPGSSVSGMWREACDYRGSRGSLTRDEV
jgi:hypothetical protein